MEMGGQSIRSDLLINPTLHQDALRHIWYKLRLKGHSGRPFCHNAVPLEIISLNQAAHDQFSFADSVEPPRTRMWAIAKSEKLVST